MVHVAIASLLPFLAERMTECALQGEAPAKGKRYFLPGLSMRGEEGAIFFRLKLKKIFAFRYARGPDDEI